jgi:hypothetical protein
MKLVSDARQHSHSALISVAALHGSGARPGVEHAPGSSLEHYEVSGSQLPFAKLVRFGIPSG